MEQWDHRVIGQRLELFHLQEEAPGCVFWHPRGWALYRKLEGFLRGRMRRGGYLEVKSPQLLDRSIWEASGHWAHFSAGMFKVGRDDASRELALKPVSCPAHVQIWKQQLRSWRDLPLRLAEFGACHRNERSGVLAGLLRVRAFVQDDGHVFCEPQHVEEEVKRFCAMVREVYAAFGFDDVGVKLSLRPEERAGDDARWDHAEAALASAARASGLAFESQPGEGAFYGPKLEFVLRDGHGREWQCGTVQLDFFIPESMDASYVDRSGQKARPVMLHRAICGSLERFLGIVLEHHRGVLPPWLSPEPVVVVPLGDPAHARVIVDRLIAEGIEARLDARDESLARRIVAAHQLAIPFVWVVGARERERGSVSVRGRDGDSRELPLEDAIAELHRAIAPPRHG